MIWQMIVALLQFKRATEYRERWGQRERQCCDLETMVLRLECTRVHFVQVSVSRPEVQGLGLGLET